MQGGRVSVVALALVAIAWTGPAAAAVQQAGSPPGGTIRGRVIDDGGRAIAGCRVAIGVLLGGGDASTLIALPLSIRTDANGEYVAHDVPPGDWYVRVEQDVLVAGALDADLPDYPVTYFPGVTDVRLARTARIAPGATVDAIDVTVPRIPVFEMALHLLGLDTAASQTLELFLNAAAAGRPRAITPRDIEPGGIVRFKRLRPGSYFVWARAQAADGSLAAWREIAIVDRSVTINLPLAPTGRMTGRIVGPESGRVAGARIVAALVDGDREIDYRAPDSGEIGADGRFAIQGVFGERRLRLIGAPEGLTVREVRVGGRAVGEPLTFPPGALIDDVEVVVGR